MHLLDLVKYSRRADRTLNELPLGDAFEAMYDAEYEPEACLDQIRRLLQPDVRRIQFNTGTRMMSRPTLARTQRTTFRFFFSSASLCFASVRARRSNS